MKKIFTSTDLASKSIEVKIYFNRFVKKWKNFHFDRFGLQIDRSELSLQPIWQKMKKKFHFDRLGL
jgi:hypothetical protein